MPGAGGGSHGGGFGGGGFHGGSSHGGSGGSHHHSRSYYWFYGGYGGSFYPKNIFGVIITPIILLCFIAVMIFACFGQGIISYSKGGTFFYDESKFEEYADDHYNVEFGNASNYEGNLLLVFLTNEKSDYFYTIAWVGYDVNKRINYMFGDETTEYGEVVLKNIHKEYENTLSDDLKNIVDEMTVLCAPYSRPLMSDGVTPHITNHTSLELNENIVNESLQNFTDQTGVPVVIVVGDMDKLFGNISPMYMIICSLIFCIFIVIAVVLFVSNLKKYKKVRKGDIILEPSPYDNKGANADQTSVDESGRKGFYDSNSHK